jgi:hypothetical protein
MVSGTLGSLLPATVLGTVKVTRSMASWLIWPNVRSTWTVSLPAQVSGKNPGGTGVVATALVSSPLRARQADARWTSGPRAAQQRYAGQAGGRRTWAAPGRLAR